MSGTHYPSYDSYELENQAYYNSRPQNPGFTSPAKKRRSCCCRPQVCISTGFIFLLILGMFSFYVYYEWKAFKSLEIQLESAVSKFDQDVASPFKHNSATAAFDLTFKVKSNNTIPLSFYDIKLTGYTSEEKEQIVLEGSLKKANFDDKVNILTIPSVLSLPLLPSSSFSKSVLKACSADSYDRLITMHFEFNFGLELLRFTKHKHTHAYKMAFECPPGLIQAVGGSRMIQLLKKIEEELSPLLVKKIDLEALQSAAQEVVNKLTPENEKNFWKEFEEFSAPLENEIEFEINIEELRPTALIKTLVFENTQLMNALGGNSNVFPKLLLQLLLESFQVEKNRVVGVDLETEDE